MEQVPPEEQYETDTIFSQEGDLPDAYLQNKLKDVESENEEVPEQNKKTKYYSLLADDKEEDLQDYHESEVVNRFEGLPATFSGDGSFEKLVEQYQFRFGENDEEDGSQLLVFDDDLYDVSKDSFRYGRVTSGVSYNVVTGKMTEDLLEKVKKQDEENDKLPTSSASKSETVTSEVTISLNSDKEYLGKDPTSIPFAELYESQMSKYFEYRKPFPEIHGIWTLFFDQTDYPKLSTFELQAGICAALNSKRYMMMCIGVDSYNNITGVEMTATDRVIFRMALTRAVAGEFQPPLIKVPIKHLTGVLPMKRDVSEFTSMIDVVFIPILGVSTANNGAGDLAGEAPKRYLIVVRVKEISEKLHQLSSGRIYTEENEQVIELSCIDEAFRVLIAENENIEGNKESIGSLFMREPEVFDVSNCSELEVIEEGPDSEEEVEPETVPQQEGEINNNDNDNKDNKEQNVDKKVVETVSSWISSPEIDYNLAEAALWTVFGMALVFGVYKVIKASR